AGPHLGGDGAQRAAAAGNRRRARHRLRRRRAGRTAGATRAPLCMRGQQQARGRGRGRTAAPVPQRRSARRRHARPALRRRRVRPGGADARADLCRQAGAGGGRRRARAAPGRTPAAVEPGPARTPERGPGLRARQPRLRRQGPAPLRCPRRPGTAQRRDGDAREATAAFRGDFDDCDEAGTRGPGPGTREEQERDMNDANTPVQGRWLHPERVALLEAALRERILVIDGAMGTMIQRHGLEEADYRGERFVDGYDSTREAPVAGGHDLRGNNDLLLLTRPQIIADIHPAYLEAGADLVETNTCNSSSVSQADYRLEHLVRELNVEGARIARECCDAVAARSGRPRFAIGVLGPTSRTASISPEVNDPGFRNTCFDELRAVYREATDGLIDGGADTLMVETVFDTLNAKAALYAIEEAFDARGGRLPVMISGTITDASGRTLSGQVAEAFYASVAHGRPLSVGLNCALGAKD